MATFPSAFDIGDPVNVTVQGSALAGHVRAVTFTSGKVRYSVSVPVDLDDPDTRTTLHNLDSAFVNERSGEKYTFDFDNYS